MADITECSPDWLRERTFESVVVEVAPSQVKSMRERGWPAPKYVNFGNVVFFVCPVPQKDSGVVEVIE